MSDVALDSDDEDVKISEDNDNKHEENSDDVEGIK